MNPHAVNARTAAVKIASAIFEGAAVSGSSPDLMRPNMMTNGLIHVNVVAIVAGSCESE